MNVGATKRKWKEPCRTSLASFLLAVLLNLAAARYSNLEILLDSPNIRLSNEVFYCLFVCMHTCMYVHTMGKSLRLWRLLMGLATLPTGGEFVHLANCAAIFSTLSLLAAAHGSDRLECSLIKVNGRLK